jgi:hypothetical protein
VNLFFKEHWDELHDESVADNFLSIEPSIYDPSGPMHSYTNILIKTTFAETRYIMSQGHKDSDWFEDMEYFLTYAPPRLVKLLRKLPDPNTVEDAWEIELAG